MVMLMLYPNRPAVRRYIVNNALEDASLTELGIQQAQATAAANREMAASSSLLPSSAVAEVVVCSPMTRAIQTAAIIFEDQLLAGDVELILRPELREYFSGHV